MEVRGGGLLPQFFKEPHKDSKEIGNWDIYDTFNTTDG